MSRKHIIISGTGRAGTTFLVELLTHIGIDTGYTKDEIKEQKHKLARAGLEQDIFNDNAPYVIKNPDFFKHAEEVFKREDIKIDHIYIPIRDVKAAAESRRRVTLEGNQRASLTQKVLKKFGKEYNYHGGLWDTDSLDEGSQEIVLLQKFYTLLEVVSKEQIPITLLHFPTIIKDPEFLFEK